MIELAQMGENKVLALPDEKEEEDDEDGGEDGKSSAEAGAVLGTIAEANDAEDEIDDDDDSENGENGMITLTTLKHCFAKNSLFSLTFFDFISVQPKVEGNQAAAASSSSDEPQPGTSSGNQNGNGTASTENAEDEEANENLQYAWEALEMAKKIFMRLGESYEEYLAEAHYGLGEILMENQSCIEAIDDYSEFDICFILFPSIFSISSNFFICTKNEERRKANNEYSLNYLKSQLITKFSIHSKVIRHLQHIGKNQRTSNGRDNIQNWSMLLFNHELR